MPPQSSPLEELSNQLAHFAMDGTPDEHSSELADLASEDTPDELSNQHMNVVIEGTPDELWHNEQYFSNRPSGWSSELSPRTGSDEPSTPTLQDCNPAESQQEVYWRTNSRTSGRLRRFSSTSGGACALAERIISGNREVQPKEFWEPNDKTEIAQALLNASYGFKIEADKKQLVQANKWNEIIGADVEQFNDWNKEQLIDLVRHCLQDLRCIYGGRPSLISDEKVTL